MRKLLILLLLMWPLRMSALTKNQVWRYINYLNIKHPEIVYAQYGQETGWGKSKAAINKCNLFGFMYKGRIMEFESHVACIMYYKRWQQRKYKGGNYYQFLIDINYAGDPAYIQRLKQIVRYEKKKGLL